MREVWKPLHGYEGLYEISSYGVVKSVRRFNPNSGKNGMWYPERIMKTRLDGDGYVVLGLTKNGKMKMCKMHRLVLETFDKESDLQVNHKDGNKQNNRLDNLEWVTCSENIKHAFRTGLKSENGSKNPKSKLTEKEVMQICDFFKYTTFTNKQIAEMFDIKSDETIRKIRKRLAWTHVTKDIEF